MVILLLVTVVRVHDNGVPYRACCRGSFVLDTRDQANGEEVGARGGEGVGGGGN